MNDRSNLDEAMLRAYSEARCVDYGCSREDVHRLRERVQQGESWCDVAQELAECNLARVNAPPENPMNRPAVSADLLQAAGCLRVAQAAMEEQPQQRLRVYERQFAVFERAMHLSSVRSEYVEIDWNGAPHGAWLFPYKNTPRWVVVWGGADGWREAFHKSVQFFHEQGLSVCLLELPGQGLARLRNRSYLGSSFASFVSAVLDVLEARESVPARFAIVGQSIGGSLALRAAVTDERIFACVTNGGSVEPEKGLTAYPRVLRRFARMLSDSIDEAQALAFIERLELSRCAREMRAALLCLHGGRDELVRDSEAQQLITLHGRATLQTWPEGVHCIYNHAAERNLVLAAWISAALSHS